MYLRSGRPHIPLAAPYFTKIRKSSDVLKQIYEAEKKCISLCNRIGPSITEILTFAPPLQATVLAAAAAPHVERAAPYVAYGIEKGSDGLARAIVYGAEKCSSGLAAGGAFAQQKVAPAAKPAEVTAEDRLKAQRLRQVTDAAAKGGDRRFGRSAWIV